MIEKKIAFLGNDKIYQQLAKLVRNQLTSTSNLSMAYVFAGQAMSGKREAANWFAQAVFCGSNRSGEPCGICPACLQIKSGAHPDILNLEKPVDKKYIPVEQVRDLIAHLNKGSFMGGYQFAIIHNADFLNDEGANSLLKTLEEPSGRTIIILLVERLDNLIRTILSRSQLFTFQPISEKIVLAHLEDNIGLSKPEAKQIARLAMGKPRLVETFLNNSVVLNKRLEIAGALFAAANIDIVSRLELVSELVGTASGQEGAQATREILDIWQLAARDWLLMRINSEDLIVHGAHSMEIKKTVGRMNLMQIKDIYTRIKQGYEHLADNVNPKLVLENIVLNI